MKLQIIVEIYEALEKMREWEDTYKALLKVSRNKKEAVETLKFLMEVSNETLHR